MVPWSPVQNPSSASQMSLTDDGKARISSPGIGSSLFITTSAFERAFPTIHNSATHSCELAYEQAQDRPRWKEDDEVEVAFKGKGFEGSWSLAKVVKPDGRSDILVRYVDFVDNDGTPLVEHVPMDRLRLPPPPAPSGWVPGLGEPVEGFWNDCWWEGCVREFHVYKGILFQCVACLHMHARAAHTHMDCMHARRTAHSDPLLFRSLALSLSGTIDGRPTGCGCRSAAAGRALPSGYTIP